MASGCVRRGEGRGAAGGDERSLSPAHAHLAHVDDDALCGEGLVDGPHGPRNERQRQLAAPRIGVRRGQHAHLSSGEGREGREGCTKGPAALPPFPLPSPHVLPQDGVGREQGSKVACEAAAARPQRRHAPRVAEDAQARPQRGGLQRTGRGGVRRRQCCRRTLPSPPLPSPAGRAGWTAAGARRRAWARSPAPWRSGRRARCPTSQRRRAARSPASQPSGRAGRLPRCHQALRSGTCTSTTLPGGDGGEMGGGASRSVCCTTSGCHKKDPDRPAKSTPQSCRHSGTLPTACARSMPTAAPTACPAAVMAAMSKACPV